MSKKEIVSLPGTLTVKSVDKISSFQFWLHCRFGNKPLVIRGGAINWSSAAWTPAYLKEVLKDIPVTLATTNVGVFDYNANANTGPVEEREQVPFSEAVDLILAGSSGGEKFSYIQQHSIAQKFPALQPQVARPAWLDGTKLMHEINLWLGSAGCFSPLHYDNADNFLVQVAGRKHLTLFDKRDTPRLYPNVGQELPHCSMVNLRMPDYTRFPLIHGAQAYSAMLEPGDLIYIPRRWWHAVHSLDTSISINYWWGGLFDIARDGAELMWTPSGRREIAAFLNKAFGRKSV